MAVRMGLMDRRAAVLLAVTTVFMVIAVGYLAFPRGSGDTEPDLGTLIVTASIPDLATLVASSDVVFVRTLDKRAVVDQSLFDTEGRPVSGARVEDERWTFDAVEFLKQDVSAFEPVEFAWVHTLHLPNSAAADDEVPIIRYGVPHLSKGESYLVFGVWNPGDTMWSSVAQLGPVGDASVARILKDGSLEFAISAEQLNRRFEGSMPETLQGLTVDDVRAAVN